MFSRLLTVSFLLVSVLTSCIIPDSNHRVPDFYLLSSKSNDLNTSEIRSDLSFYINEVRLAHYLQDKRMVSRPNNEIIEFREYNRWGEPLEIGICRVVGQNLSSSLNTYNYVVFPHRKKFGLQYEIDIKVDRFEKVSEQRVRCKAFWELSRKDGKTKSNLFDKELKIPSAGERIEVRTLSSLIELLSKEIETAILSFD